MKTIWILLALVSTATALDLCVLRHKDGRVQFSFEGPDRMDELLSETDRLLFAQIASMLTDPDVLPGKRAVFEASAYRCGLGTDPQDTTDDFFVGTHPDTQRLLVAVTIEDRVDVVFMEDARFSVEAYRQYFSHYHIICSVFAWMVDIVDDEGWSTARFVLRYPAYEEEKACKSGVVVSRVLTEEQSLLGREGYAEVEKTVLSGKLRDSPLLEEVARVMQCQTFSDAELAEEVKKTKAESMDELALQTCRYLRRRADPLFWVYEMSGMVFFSLVGATLLTAFFDLGVHLWEKMKGARN